MFRQPSVTRWIASASASEFACEGALAVEMVGLDAGVGGASAAAVGGADCASGGASFGVSARSTGFLVAVVASGVSGRETFARHGVSSVVGVLSGTTSGVSNTDALVSGVAGGAVFASNLGAGGGGSSLL